MTTKEAIEVLKDMKIETSLPKAAVTQRKRNAAIDVAIEALNNHLADPGKKVSSSCGQENDPVSRQAAIDAVDKLSDEPIGYLEAAIDALVDLPSAQPEQRWIPCSERLPKDEIAYYLVTLVNHGLLTYGDIDIARWDYDRRKGKESWHWCKEREVIAWMPLPEPYRGEEK